MQTFIQFLPMILILCVFYAMILLPERKRRKKYDAMLSELKVNDQIITKGGIIGSIISLDEENLVLESGPDRTRLRFSKNAVAHKIEK
ncbi:MAG: preprotein translocase subunit YajC [Clostridium sp.]|nr:preprotein translocase subunit YajC [Clostridium sp.]